MIRDPLDGSRGHLTPPPCEGAAKGRVNKPESSPRSPRAGPSSGARRTATPPRYAPNTGECRYVRVAPPRSAETLPKLAETNTSHTDKMLRKNLAGAFTLLQGFGGYTRGCASAPPRNNTAMRGEESPISKRQALRVPNRYHCRGPGATIGAAIGIPNSQGKCPFRKIIKAKEQTHEPQNMLFVVPTESRRAHGPESRNGPPNEQPRYPSGESLPRSRTRRHATKSPPRLRADAPTGESPPRSRA
jgi:hypothetical protein